MNTVSRDLVGPVPPRMPARHRRAPIQFSFDNQHGYTMVKGMYSRMIHKLQLFGGSQYIQYIYALLMDPEFGFMENIMLQMMGKIFQIIKLSKGYPDTPNSNKTISVPYKVEFTKATTQDIKELEQHGTWTILSRKSVNGSHIITSTWDFKVNCFPEDILRNFKDILCARCDRQIKGVYLFENYANVVSWNKVKLMIILRINKGWSTRQVDFTMILLRLTW